MVPTVHAQDSAEFAIAAATLGIAHAPGYPLYVSLAHGFTYLPLGDVAFRVNLLSALSIAGTVPLLYHTFYRLTGARWASLASALSVVWSPYIWTHGLAAEIYGPQVFTLSVVGYSLARLQTQRAGRDVLAVGGAYGVAVAMHPASALFAPGVAWALWRWHIPARWMCAAGLLALGLFALSLLYFPLVGDDATLNAAGAYNTAGEFQAIDLDTLEGIAWMLSGGQFESEFFERGYLPNGEQVSALLSWFLANYQVVGLGLGALGLWQMARQQRGLALTWGLLFAPYTYFFMLYGVPDRELMFGPSYLLWGVGLAFGLRALQGDSSQRAYWALLVPLFFLITSYPALNIRQDASVRARAEATLQALPPEALVFGSWGDVMPLQYLHWVEDERPDLTFYNLFLFPEVDLVSFIATQEARPIIFLGDYVRVLLPAGRYTIRPIDVTGADEIYRVEASRAARPGARRLFAAGGQQHAINGVDDAIPRDQIGISDGRHVIDEHAIIRRGDGDGHAVERRQF